MHTRCTSDQTSYAYGTPICERWSSFANFLADMGESPGPGFSIDRIDNDRGYEPGNCRWATRTVQNRNRTYVRFERHEPAQVRWLLTEGFTGKEIARFFEVSESSVSLIKRGVTWL